MLRGLLAVFLCLSLPSPAQGQEAVEPSDRGFAYDDCAPWDGGAVRIVLTSEADTGKVVAQQPAPGLELVAHTNLEEAIGRTFALQANPRNNGHSGSARWCDSTCVSAIDGWLRIKGASGETVTGSYQVRFPNQEVIRGRFQTGWLRVKALCG